jgi:hypothetical protein
LSADWLCLARIPDTTVTGSSASSLVDAMCRRGTLRPFKPESTVVPGAEIDRRHHPIDAKGNPCERIWVLGPLCEGAIFYNQLVPSPNTWSRPIADAYRCVAELLDQISTAKSVGVRTAHPANVAAQRRRSHSRPSRGGFQ